MLLNQVWGLVGNFKKLKDDILHIHDGSFQYSNQGPDILLLWMTITHKFDIPVKRKFLAKESLSMKIPIYFYKMIYNVKEVNRYNVTPYSYGCSDSTNKKNSDWLMPLTTGSTAVSVAAES